MTYCLREEESRNVLLVRLRA